VVARVALATAALAICACLVAGLRAARLQAEGERPVFGGGTELTGIEPAELEDRLDALRDARRFNPDPTPEIREGQLLVVAHRDREAVRLLQDVLEREPKNYEAWLGLRQAAIRADPQLAREATREALALNPLARREPRGRP
jgi:hypothetical protein